MKYYEVTFGIRPWMEDAADVLAALLAEAGFEAFESDGQATLTGYVQQRLWNEEGVREATAALPFEVEVTWERQEAPYGNWNAAWEEEGFQPVVVGEGLVCVHSTEHEAPMQCRHDITVNPRMAFGSGNHPTTQMMLAWLAQADLTGQRMVDAGCGTGVLGILAMQRGASEVLAYDIDEWSTANARENFAMNGFHDGVRVVTGDASVLEGERDHDLVVANINRNILMADMERFKGALKGNGRLLLSGFYPDDAKALTDKAASLGLRLLRREEVKGWCLLLLG